MSEYYGYWVLCYFEKKLRQRSKGFEWWMEESQPKHLAKWDIPSTREYSLELGQPAQVNFDKGEGKLNTGLFSSTDLMNFIYIYKEFTFCI